LVVEQIAVRRINFVISPPVLPRWVSDVVPNVKANVATLLTANNASEIHKEKTRSAVKKVKPHAKARWMPTAAKTQTVAPHQEMGLWFSVAIQRMGKQFAPL